MVPMEIIRSFRMRPWNPEGRFNAGQALLRKIAGWLKPQGLLFVHIFTHKTLAYHFEVSPPTSSADLPLNAVREAMHDWFLLCASTSGKI